MTRRGWAVGAIVLAAALALVAAWHCGDDTSNERTPTPPVDAPDAPPPASKRPEPRARRPADADAEPAARPVRGRVVDADGRPAPGVTVRLLDEVEDWRSSSVELLSGDDGGFVAADREERWAFALRPGEVSAFAPLGGDDAPCELRLGPGGLVEGTVRDETGAPLAGAVVALQDDAEWSARTVADGTYRIAGVPLGTEIRAGVRDEGRARPPDRTDDDAPPPSHVFGAHGETWRLDLAAVLEPGVDTTFEFRLPPGVEPPAYLALSTRVRSGGSELRSNGGLPFGPDAPPHSVHLRRGAHEMTFHLPGCEPFRYRRTVAGDAPPETVVVAFAPSAGRVLVRPVGEDGRPLPSPDVKLDAWMQDDRQGLRVHPGPRSEDGTFDVTTEVLARTPGDAARLRLYVHGPGLFAHAGDGMPDREVSVGTLRELRAARGGRDLVLDVPCGPSLPVEVHALDDDGRPVAGVTLRTDADVAGPSQVVTDARGVATIRLRSEPRRAGTSWNRIVAAPPHEGACSLLHRTTADSGEPGLYEADGRWHARVLLGATRAVRGIVVDEAGSPVGGLVARPHDSVGGPAAWVSRADGRFETRLPLRDAVFAPRFDDFVAAPVALPPGGADVRVVVLPARWLTVQALGAAEDDSPVATDLVWRGGADRREIRRLGERHFGRVHVPRAEVEVRAASADGRLRGQATAAADADSVTLTLEPVRTETVDVEVVDPRGVPVEGVRVRVAGDPRGIVTGAGGLARVDVADAGRRRVAVDVEGHVVRPAEVEVGGPRSAPSRVVAQPVVLVRLLPYSSAPREHEAALVQTLSDGSRLAAERLPSTCTRGEGETLRFALAASAPSALDAEIDGRTFTWTFDPAAPAVFAADLE